MYTPLCWIRRLEVLNSTHIFADFVILLTISIVVGYTIQYAQDYPISQGVVAFNSHTFLNIIGFSVYAYEGIGVILPVMEITEKKESYNTIVFIVITTLFLLYLAYGQLCYLVYGGNLKLPLITSYLPDNAFTSFTKVFFCLNLIFTYPLVIYPAFQTLEGKIFKKMRAGNKKMWTKNLFRAFVVAITIVIPLLLDDKLSKFLSLLGALGCVPIAFNLPCVFHYILCAKTASEKRIDMFLIILSLIIVVFCTWFVFYTWNG